LWTFMLQQVPLFWLYSSTMSQEGRTTCESCPSLVSLHILKIGANMQECQRKLCSFLQRPVQGVLNVLVCHFANALLAVTSWIMYFFFLTLWNLLKVHWVERQVKWCCDR
jgi:hypothetical protein